MTTPTPAEANRLFYAEHAVDYDATEFCANAALGQQRLRQGLAPALGALPPDARVLDAGGGSGNASRYLFEQGLQPVLVDVSAEMVALWRSKASALGYEPQTQVAELEAFFAGDQRSWDLVVFSSVLHHLEDPGRLLGQVARRLAPGGFIVTVFDPLQLPHLGAILRKLDYVGWLIVHARGELPRVVAQRLRPGAGSAARVNVAAVAECHAGTGSRRSRPHRGARWRGPPGGHAPAHLRLPLLAHPSLGARDADADRILSRGSGSGDTAGKREGTARLRLGMASAKRALITWISGQDGSCLGHRLPRRPAKALPRRCPGTWVARFPRSRRCRSRPAFSASSRASTRDGAPSAQQRGTRSLPRARAARRAAAERGAPGREPPRRRSRGTDPQARPRNWRDCAGQRQRGHQPDRYGTRLALGAPGERHQPPSGEDDQRYHCQQPENAGPVQQVDERVVGSGDVVEILRIAGPRVIESAAPGEVAGAPEAGTYHRLVCRLLDQKSPECNSPGRIRRLGLRLDFRSPPGCPLPAVHSRLQSRSWRRPR